MLKEITTVRVSSFDELLNMVCNKPDEPKWDARNGDIVRAKFGSVFVRSTEYEGVVIEATDRYILIVDDKAMQKGVYKPLKFYRDIDTIINIIGHIDMSY